MVVTSQQNYSSNQIPPVIGRAVREVNFSLNVAKVISNVLIADPEET